MNKLGIIALAASLLAAVASCNMEDADRTGGNSKYDLYAPYVSHVVSVSELQDGSPEGRALIDLGLPGHGYWVEPGIDYSDVDILCPNGRSMTLQQELDELGMSPAQWQDGLFIYRPGEGDAEVQQKNAPECRAGCNAIYEGPGSWHCTC